MDRLLIWVTMRRNRLVSVSGAVAANVIYDGDRRRVKSTLNGTTTYFIGNHYELTGSTATKYCYAGTQRVAVRTGSTLSYITDGATDLGSSGFGLMFYNARWYV